MPLSRALRSTRYVHASSLVGASRSRFLLLTSRRYGQLTKSVLDRVPRSRSSALYDLLVIRFLFVRLGARQGRRPARLKAARPLIPRSSRTHHLSDA